MANSDCFSVPRLARDFYKNYCWASDSQASSEAVNNLQSSNNGDLLPQSGEVGDLLPSGDEEKEGDLLPQSGEEGDLLPSGDEEEEGDLLPQSGEDGNLLPQNGDVNGEGFLQPSLGDVECGFFLAYKNGSPLELLNSAHKVMFSKDNGIFLQFQRQSACGCCYVAYTCDKKRLMVILLFIFDPGGFFASSAFFLRLQDAVIIVAADVLDPIYYDVVSASTAETCRSVMLAVSCRFAGVTDAQFGSCFNAKPDFVGISNDLAKVHMQGMLM